MKQILVLGDLERIGHPKCFHTQLTYQEKLADLLYLVSGKLEAKLQANERWLSVLYRLQMRRPKESRQSIETLQQRQTPAKWPKRDSVVGRSGAPKQPEPLAQRQVVVRVL